MERGHMSSFCIYTWPPKMCGVLAKNNVLIKSSDIARVHSHYNKIYTQYLQFLVHSTQV